MIYTTIMMISRFFLFLVVGNVLRSNGIFSYPLIIMLLFGIVFEPLFILWVCSVEIKE